MATGNALRREQAAIRPAIAGHTWPGPVWRTPVRRRRNGITLSGAARERGALSAQHRLGHSRGTIPGDISDPKGAPRYPLEPSQADRHPDQLRNEPSLFWPIECSPAPTTGSPRPCTRSQAPAQAPVEQPRPKSNRPRSNDQRFTTYGPGYTNDTPRKSTVKRRRGR
eukprot:scaffold5897_cov129-Isochrysis_galbana.AAC.4